ncbi:MAG: bifunctional glutamate N-acetyltransferase/amino-acid acetyltransferase ArgJ [Candidatus Acidiferrales bacterium]
MSAKKNLAPATEASGGAAPTTTPLSVPEPIPAQALPKGFRFAAAACGLRRKNRLDLGVVIADKPCTAAGMFTRNLVKAAPVVLCEKHLAAAAARIRAIVVNSGNANCANGPAGMRASRATAKTAARALRCRDAQILVCSTGVIGLPLPVEKIVAALPELSRTAAAVAANYDAFTHSIMTTDTRPKWAAATCRIGGKTVRLLGCAKGAGMIHPNLATMLAFLLTDAAASPRVLHKALAEVSERTFNSITVDGDTSTNDTALLLASGSSKSWGTATIPPAGHGYKVFVVALEKVCKKLAVAIVSDGEGASRVVEIEVRGAPDNAAAKTVAQTIATSPLVKTALAGGDPNWGRILAAAGRAGVHFRPERAAIRMAGLRVYDRGRALPFDEGAAHEKLLSNAVPIVMDLHAGRGRARVWTCDFTAEYVHINASYRT